MDQITVDVTDVPAHLALPGCEVEIIGTDKDAPNHLPLLAALAETITHEMLCRISPQLERVYVASEVDSGEGEVEVEEDASGRAGAERLNVAGA
jgi:hypothetical protein